MFWKSLLQINLNLTCNCNSNFPIAFLEKVQGFLNVGNIYVA